MSRETLFIFFVIVLATQIPFLKRQAIFYYTAVRVALIMVRCKSGCESTDTEVKPCLLHEEKVRKLENIGKKNQ